ncbi:MAG: acyltransferase [Bacteroidia bacterium]
MAKIPFHFVRIAFYRYVMSFKIGSGSSIHLGVKFNSRKFFEMGNNSTINQDCRIDNRGGIIIGNNVSISPNVKLITADHDLSSTNFKGREGIIQLDDYVFIGTDAIVLKNIRMHYGSALSAKSLLTRTTKHYGIYAGIPAKWVKNRPEGLDYNCSYLRWFY